MWRWWRYIRSIRSPMLASSSVARVEMESPIDCRAIAREESSPLFVMAAPAVEIARSEQLFERRACRGRAEDDPGVGPRGPSDLPPQRGQGRGIHPVDPVEQDIAIAAPGGLAADPIGHPCRMAANA